MCLTKQTYCGGVEEFPPGPVRMNRWGMRNGSTLKPLGLSTIVVAKKQKETTLWEMALLPQVPGGMTSASLRTPMNFTNFLQTIPSGLRRYSGPKSVPPPLLRI